MLGIFLRLENKKKFNQWMPHELINNKKRFALQIPLIEHTVTCAKWTLYENWGYSMYQFEEGAVEEKRKWIHNLQVRSNFFFFNLSPLLIQIVQQVVRYKSQDSFSPRMIFFLLPGETLPPSFNLHSTPRIFAHYWESRWQ